MFKLSEARTTEKGAMFVEYAVAVAFVIAVGAIFISSSSITDNINSIFGKTGETLAMATGGEQSTSKPPLATAPPKPEKLGQYYPSLEWLQSDELASLYKECGTTYLQINADGVYGGYGDNASRDILLNKLAAEIGYKPEDIAYQYGKNGQNYYLKYVIREGNPITSRADQLNCYVAEYTPDGKLKSVYQDKTSLIAFRETTSNNVPERYNDVGFWNSGTKNYIYQDPES